MPETPDDSVFGGEILSDLELQERRHSDAEDRLRRRRRDSRLVLLLPALIGVGLLLWQVVQRDPTDWIIFGAAILVVPLLSTYFEW